MLLVPVIDVKDAAVVHAVAGRRDGYRPLNSPLCPGADPATLVSRLLALHPFPVIYVADLDAIEGRGNNRPQITSLVRAHGAVSFWVDAGFAHADDLGCWPADARFRPVLGSESQSSVAAFVTLLDACRHRRPILSLDHLDGARFGPAELFREPALWPRDVIVMQLDRVGRGAGPATRPPAAGTDARFYAAGGVRDGADVERLAQAGFAGVLLASALHGGRLDARELARIAGMGCGQAHALRPVP